MSNTNEQDNAVAEESCDKQFPVALCNEGAAIRRAYKLGFIKGIKLEKERNNPEANNGYRRKLGSEISSLKADLAVAVEALEHCHDLQDDDYINTETSTGEEEIWVNSRDLRRICDEALASLDKGTKERG